MQRVWLNLLLALEGIRTNRLRSFLTALGIVFGVGAVIAMLAIGTGARQAILDQLKIIGANAIVVRAVLPSGKEADQEDQQDTPAGLESHKSFSPGLTLEDLDVITQVLPTVEKISPEIILQVDVVQSGKLIKTRCVGVTNTFFELNQLTPGNGNLFHDQHLQKGNAVCIIGKNLQTRLFGQTDPIGRTIKCGASWLTVIGVLEQRSVKKENLETLGLRDYNDDVYIPVITALRRFEDRSVVVRGDIGRRRTDQPEQNYHQLDRVVIRVDDSRKLQASARLIAGVLQRRHQGVIDFEVEVPELLLEQEQKTQETFNLVLAVIAGISLLVGGIGIMNIMLASVLERIKEIGVRRSMGANRRDIILQFLLEAVAISLIGGILGVGLGIGAARVIASSAGIPTIISGWSVLLSFGIAASIGLLFGLLPARRAARMDPIKALRSE